MLHKYFIDIILFTQFFRDIFQPCTTSWGFPFDGGPSKGPEGGSPSKGHPRVSEATCSSILVVDALLLS
jgi:hypothetical protein